MRKLFAIVALVLLAACSTTNVATTVSDAKAVLHGLEATYVASLNVATTWARQPRCGTGSPPVPLCSTVRGVIAMEGARIVARNALDTVTAAINSADAATITAALTAAREAIASYGTTVNTSKGN